MPSLSLSQQTLLLRGGAAAATKTVITPAAALCAVMYADAPVRVSARLLLRAAPGCGD